MRYPSHPTLLLTFRPIPAILIPIMKNRPFSFRLTCLVIFALMAPFCALADNPPYGGAPAPFYPQYEYYYLETELIFNDAIYMIVGGEAIYQNPENYFKLGYCDGAVDSMVELYPTMVVALVPPATVHPYPLTTAYKQKYYALADAYLYYADVFWDMPEVVNQFYLWAGYYWAMGDAIDYVYVSPIRQQ